ncbi:MAG: TldD/PmbA family protein [Nitrospiraceae bacterium]
MIPLTTLRTTVQRALRLVARMKDIREAEVYASSAGHLLCRLNYTSEIPCHGVEEPKSSDFYGISVRAVFNGSSELRVGFGSEARDLSPVGVRRALEKARQNATSDPEFVSFPALEGKPSPGHRLGRYHDPALMDVKDRALVEAGWRVINEALRTFSASERLSQLAGSKDKLASLGLIVSGDVSLMRQRIAVGSTRLPKVQTDESTFIKSFVTAMVERQQAKGSGYAATTHLSKFKGEAGAEAARSAIMATGGQRFPSGTYTVVFGPQAVSDLMGNLVLPSLGADAFYSSRSAFLGELGRPVASEILTIYDQGVAKGWVGSRAITCEGLPAGRTDLIRGGVLQGLLSNHYESQRLRHDPRAREKLGLNPHDHPEALSPRNGFRVSSRGGRQFDVQPSIAATNVCIEGNVPHSSEGLLSLVGNGLYIGRIWYTYAINGLRAGDFTCTVVGDSYLIKDGHLSTPLQANTIRVTGNIRQLLTNVIGVTKKARPILGWGADEVIYAPELAVKGITLSEIAQYMETV